MTPKKTKKGLIHDLPKKNQHINNPSNCEQKQIWFDFDRFCPDIRGKIQDQPLPRVVLSNCGMSTAWWDIQFLAQCYTFVCSWSELTVVRCLLARCKLYFWTGLSSQNHDSESELETVRCLCFHLFFSPTFFSPTNQTFVIVCNFCLKSTHNSTYMFFRVKMWMNLWFIIWTLDPLMCLQSLRPWRFHSGNPKETVVLRYLKFLWVIFFPNWPSCFSLLIYFMILFLFSLSLSISIFVSLLLCPSSLWVCIYFTLVNTRSLCSLYVSQGEDGRVITQWVVTHSGYERGTHITVSPLSSHINVDNPHQSWAHLLPPVTPANGSVLDHFWPVRVVIFMSWCMFFSFYCFYYWKL